MGRREQDAASDPNNSFSNVVGSQPVKLNSKANSKLLKPPTSDCQKSVASSDSMGQKLYSALVANDDNFQLKIIERVLNVSGYFNTEGAENG